MVWSEPFISGFSSHGEQIQTKAAEKATACVNASALDSAQSLAADEVSSAAATLTAYARGESPRANDYGSQVELIY